MKTSTFCAAIFLAILTFFPGESLAGDRPSQVKAALSIDYKIINHVQDIDAEFFALLFGSRKLLADPDKPFQATDTIGAEALPDRRLLFAGTSDSLCFMLYEHGGIGLHFHLACAVFKDAHWRLFYLGRSTTDCKSITELRQAFNRGLFEECTWEH